jgi:hypothetical protein
MRRARFWRARSRQFKSHGDNWIVFGFGLESRTNNMASVKCVAPDACLCASVGHFVSCDLGDWLPVIDAVTSITGFG